MRILVALLIIFALAGAVSAPTIDVTLSNVPVDFGNVLAGSTNQSASPPLNVTIESSTNVNVNLTLNGSDFTAGSASFAIGNLRYSNDTTVTNSTVMNTSFPPSPPFADWVNISRNVTTNRSIFFWISIPAGQKAGVYNSTIYVNVTEYI